MVLDNQRENINPILNTIAKRLINVNPNILTWISLLFAFIAGVFFFLSSPQTELNNFYLLFAVFFVFLNGFLDAIDGKVAKLSKKNSIRGDFLDHAVDRYADVFIVGGLALSPWFIDHQYIGILAIIGMLLTSYMGTQAQAIGYKREYSGLLGRADRLFLLMIVPIFQHLWLFYSGTGLLLNLFLMEWILVYFAVVGNITAIQRFYLTLKHIKKNVKKQIYAKKPKKP